MKLRHAAAGVLPIAVLALGAPASGGQSDKDTFSFAFTTAKAKAPAGFNAEAEFPRQRVIDQLTITFPAGTTFDRKAVVQCTATDEQITAAENGVSSACPAESKIGTGKGTAYLGDGPDPITFDLAVYNADQGGPILDIQLNGKTAFYSALNIAGRKMTIPLSQSPSLNARITGFELSIARAGTAKKPFLRTPATCPRKKKKLTASIAVREHNAGTVSTSDTTPCRR